MTLNVWKAISHAASEAKSRLSSKKRSSVQPGDMIEKKEMDAINFQSVVATRTIEEKRAKVGIDIANACQEKRQRIDDIANACLFLDQEHRFALPNEDDAAYSPASTAPFNRQFTPAVPALECSSPTVSDDRHKRRSKERRTKSLPVNESPTASARPSGLNRKTVTFSQEVIEVRYRLSRSRRSTKERAPDQTKQDEGRDLTELGVDTSKRFGCKLSVEEDASTGSPTSARSSSSSGWNSPVASPRRDPTSPTLPRREKTSPTLSS